MANQLKTTVLLAALTVLIVLIGRVFGGNQGMIIAFVFAMIMNFSSYWFSDKIVLAMYRAQELSEAEAPEIHRMVADLAARAGVPKPKIYLIPTETPNAFATGRNPEHAVVAVTQGIVKMLDPKELRGVLAHEMGHVKNRDILIGSIAATLAGVVMMLASMARFAAFFGLGGSDDEDGGGNILVLIIMSIVAPLAAMLIQMAISRSREYLADSTAARFTGDPESLASALEKLAYGAKQLPMQQATPATAHMFTVSPLAGGGIAKLFSTHPPIEERVRRLRAMAPAA
ncbi:MAG: zinc metalloprotease HtpX [Deltaproteobacteria bacterium]|nr:zinc metalloprotease HtpX [Deltaproteobacteria bacterium]MBW2070978.1 zinc metalloprotease HtpX [Deltaproteobacteria bacterium]